AEIEIDGKPKRFPEHGMQRSLGQAAVAHAREQVEALHRDPVGGALVAEELAPAARARGLAAAFAIADRAGAGDDVDSVFAAERSDAGYHHVVPDVIAPMPQQRLEAFVDR